MNGMISCSRRGTGSARSSIVQPSRRNQQRPRGGRGRAQRTAPEWNRRRPKPLLDGDGATEPFAVGAHGADLRRRQLRLVGVVIRGPAAIGLLELDGQAWHGDVGAERAILDLGTRDVEAISDPSLVELGQLLL